VTDHAELLTRIGRLEAAEQIRQLAARYGLAIDARDIDAVVALFVDDGRPVFFRNDNGTPGGQALRDSYHVSQSRYTCSQHFMGNHVIDIDDDDHAHGVVYAFVHQELGDHWTVAAMQYWDKYERVDGRWLFAERRPQSWYFTEWENKPVGPHKMRFPGQPATDASLPAAWPSWDEFWSQHPTR
jgi:hypothetical protein